MKTRMKRIVAAGVLAALLPAFTMYAQKDTTITAGTWKYTGEYPVGEGTLYSYEEGLISGHFVECVAEGPGISTFLTEADTRGISLAADGLDTDSFSRLQETSSQVTSKTGRPTDATHW